MNTTCENCKGEGLVGGGDKPWLKEGAISTCVKCSGKGIIPEVIPDVVSEVPEKAPDEESSVDNLNVPLEDNENVQNDSTDSEMNEEEKKIDVAEDKGDSVVE